MRIRIPALFAKSAFAAAAIVTLGFTPSATAEKYASIVVDLERDEVLHARHADAPRYPASLTKAMTLYMLFPQTPNPKPQTPNPSYMVS